MTAPYPWLVPSSAGRRLRLDYETWTDLQADLHTGLPTGTNLDVIGARARIDAEWDLAVSDAIVHVGVALHPFKTKLRTGQPQSGSIATEGARVHASKIERALPGGPEVGTPPRDSSAVSASSSIGGRARSHASSAAPRSSAPAASARYWWC